MKSERESKVERDDSKLAKAAGWFVEKIMQAARNGFPDRFYARAQPEDVCFCCGRGRVILMEWKKVGKDAERQQEIRHTELRAAGVEVHVVDSIEQAEAIRRGG